ncbi:MAG: glycosyltransferase [Pseudomonadota bacterium]
MPRVSVIIPHYDDLASLDRCLGALDDQTCPRDVFEVIVADNMTEVLPGVLERTVATRARLVRVEDKGAGPARNGGVAAATGDLLAFIDCDCVPEADWLAQGLAALDRYDVVGGAMVVSSRSGRAMSGAEAFERVFAFNNRRYVEQEGFSVTANLFTTRRVFEHVGGFRNGVSEDKDWCHRARGLGYRIGYAHDAVASHPARQTWPELRKKWARLNTETYGLYRLRRNGRIKWLLRTWCLPASVAAHAPAVVKSDQLGSVRQRAAAFGTLVRLRLWRFVDAHRLLLGRN